MLDLKEVHDAAPELQLQPWPSVNEFTSLPDGFAEFIGLAADRQRDHLASRRQRTAEHGRILHSYLDVVSAYLFGYVDSPCYGRLEDRFEAELLQAKLVLERELLERWLPVLPSPPLRDQAQTCDYLTQLSRDNVCLAHPLFDYLANRASVNAIRTFLLTEVTRNEVVDDEIAMLLVGLQGPMKLAVASNLWDECGSGRLVNFHTYWLRRLVAAYAGWTGLKDYRRNDRPWFTQITTNVFNIFLSRPGIRLMAYGWFLINESWVAPHFERILQGIRRTSACSEDAVIYFTAHRKIDPTHTAELMAALSTQMPRLTAEQCLLVTQGAHAAVHASYAQYDRMLQYLTELSR